ncbi:MAG TPA: hypothetical protein VMW91_03820 [Desulfosporosinus sp.]|nr:hypothetical protein [Desulfosporosinus sp.]
MTMLPNKMKAIIAYAPGDYRLEEINVPGINVRIIAFNRCK